MADIAERFAVPGSWQFTPEVVDAFDTHVEQSVPFYAEIQALAAEVCDWLAPAGSTIADLGCATGTTVERITRRHPERGYCLHLYDASDEMLDQAAKKLAGAGAEVVCHLGRLEDGLDHQQASLTLALVTLQFLDPRDRIAVLDRARQCSRQGGALLVAEKLALVDARWHEIAGAVSHDRKSARGITDQAIRAKERALRGVLIPAADADYRAWLAATGWQSAETLFRWHSWVVYGAFAS